MGSNLKLVPTADGSNTIWNDQVGEHYHSRHGAFQESKHVFLKSGLEFFLDTRDKKEVSILEVGFGTGLNFFLTADFCTKNNINLSYTGIEAFPLSADLILQTGYEQFVEQKIWAEFALKYDQFLSKRLNLNAECNLKILECKLENYSDDLYYDVLYFDAFAAVHQPEMWSDEALACCCHYLKPGGVFVTYAITGNLKRSMKKLGFTIEKAPGAPGKREMLRAVKL